MHELVGTHPGRLLGVDATGIGTAFELVMGAAVWAEDRINPPDIVQRAHKVAAAGVANDGNGNEAGRRKHREGLHGSRVPSPARIDRMG